MDHAEGALRRRSHLGLEFRVRAGRLEISGVDAHGPGARAGLAVGDTLLSVHEAEVRTFLVLRRAVGALAAGAA
jgi:S1-C subfamily serine protease